MDNTIIAAIIGAVALCFGTILGVLLEHHLAQKRAKPSGEQQIQQSGIRIERAPLSFESVTPVTKLRIYAISTTNIVSAFEQHHYLQVDECIVLLRLLNPEHPLYTDDYQQEIDARVNRWKAMLQEGRIKRLSIIGYDNLPDIFYMLFDQKQALLNVIQIDKNDPCNQAVGKVPVLADAEKEDGKELISRLALHFDNYADYCRKHGTVIFEGHNYV